LLLLLRLMTVFSVKTVRSFVRLCCCCWRSKKNHTCHEIEQAGTAAWIARTSRSRAACA
jgi:hypothetical protein